MMRKLLRWEMSLTELLVFESTDVLKEIIVAKLLLAQFDNFIAILIKQKKL